MHFLTGRQTWDPLASEEKIQKEQNKYKQCKEEYGFCIPGYQVYKLETGKLQKYNKEYGKKLHGHMVRNGELEIGWIFGHFGKISIGKIREKSYVTGIIYMLLICR